MNTWPISKQPVFPLENGRENNVLSSAQTNGVVIRRLRYPVARHKIGPATWQYLSAADYALLMNFYDANSALPFVFSYIASGGTVSKTVCFSEPPKETYTEFGWQVQCTFEEV